MTPMAATMEDRTGNRPTIDRPTPERSLEDRIERLSAVSLKRVIDTANGNPEEKAG